jgi:hypothetical protein
MLGDLKPGEVGWLHQDGAVTIQDENGKCLIIKSIKRCSLGTIITVSLSEKEA